MTRRTIRIAGTCSALALATALAAAPAAAQVATGSFQGTPTVTFGAANVTEGPGTTDVQVDSSSAVIDWAPDDTAISNGAPINFQPAGTTATFHNDPVAMNDFALLNRIVPVDPTRPILFDGTVISRLQTLAGQVPGGTVFFYSPGGIIVGANAVFDVGNLGLTTAAPLVDGNGNWYVGNQVQFQQANSSSFVDIDPGASISAISQGSYVAVFSPYIEQGGLIDVNGQAALVAGEAGSITFSPDGLFDIQVTIGSDGQGGVGIDHTGTTTGSASGGAGDNHRIYMVAVPKNALLLMAFERGSSVGFDVAGAADTVGNAVVLSAGRNIAGGNIDMSSRVAGGTIDINDSNTGLIGTGIDFTSAVTAEATQDVNINIFRQTNFASDASFHADRMAFLAIGAIPSDSTGALNVGGNFTLSSNRFAPIAGEPGDAGSTFFFASDGATASIGGAFLLASNAILDNDGDGLVTGGTAQLSLDTGASLDVGGDLLVRASAFTDSDPAAIDAIGGSAQVLLFGASSLDVAGVTRIDAYGIAGANNGFGGFGADGTGGFSSLMVAEGSTATLNELNVAADGVGGADAGAGPGDGFGGTAQIQIDGAGSTLNVQLANVTGDINLGELDFLSAEGIGGVANGLGSSVGGTGTGGFAGIFGSAGATLNLPIDPAGELLRVIARGTGGAATADGTTGGDGIGGDIAIFLDNATMAVENLLPSLVGLGGNATSTAGTINGGNGFGGNRNITLVNGSTFTGSIVGGTVGGGGGSASDAGRGGNGSGGFSSISIDNSTFTVTQDSVIIGQATGGLGAIGGDATGADVFFEVINGGLVDTATSGATLEITSNAFGGDASTGGASQGGNAHGGNVSVVIDNSTVNGDFGIGALGIGGNLFGNVSPSGGVSGDGIGGTAGLVLRNATITGNTLEVSAVGLSGSVDATGISGLASGAGIGGSATINADVGSSNVTVNLIGVDASGEAGPLLAGSGTGGDGTGGSAAIFAQENADLTLNGAVTVLAEGRGGATTDGGIGGAGIGGNNAQMFVFGVGTITVNGVLNLSASATGGNGAAGGGSATAGGFASIDAQDGSILINGDANVMANALGGAALVGGAGGDASGGLAQVGAFTGASPNSVTITNNLLAEASATGGAGANGAGGAATGGSVSLFANANGALDINNATMFANATGGSATGSGAGGAATGGSVFVDANGGAIVFAFDANADALAFGGNSVDGNGGAAQGGGVVYHAFGGGTIDQTDGLSDLTADVAASGGSASGLGNGGDATAGEATVHADGGAMTIAGNLGIGSDATGGDGVNGGSATGSLDEFAIVNSFLLAGNGGSVAVGGQTGLSTFLQGGSGRAGGAGGDATGGAVVVLAQSNTAGSNGGQITLNDLFAFNVATGGQGGASSGTGGVGGDGAAGVVRVLGDAGNGHLVVNGSTDAETVGQGGLGGDGAIGGLGGTGSGGFINVGTRSGPATTDNTGSATFGDVTLVAAGFGGGGGTGSSGAGGDGGDGINGAAVLLVRGSPVTIGGTANLFAEGIGGNGGVGSTTDGAGGDGIVGDAGGIGIEATNRFEIPGDRGLLFANSIFGQAFAAGGSGSTTGEGLVGEAPATVNFSGADGDIGTLSFGVSGDRVTGTAPSTITLTGATLDVNDFSFATPSDLVLALDGAVLNAGQFFLQARELVLPATAPVSPGTVNISNGMGIFVDSGASIRTYANFVTDFGVGFSVDGDFQTGGFTASGDIFFESLGGNVTTGDLAADGSVEVVAALAVAVGDAIAGQSVSLEGGTTVTGGDLTAGDTVEARAQGDIVLGNLSAGIVNPASEAELSVGIISLAGSVSTGDVAAANRIAMLAGNGATLGNLEAPDVLLLMGGNLSTGGIDADRVHIADDSDSAIGGPLDGDGFDFEAVFASDPTPSGGSIQIGGPVAASSSFRAASSGAFTAGVIGSPTISVDSQSLVTVNGLWSGSNIDVSSADIAIASTGGLDAGATGTLQLVSTNFSGMFVGDGFDGSGGYRLDNAEFGRLSGGEILIAGVNNQEGPNGVSMTIGDLTINGNQLGGPGGSLDFATGDPQTETPGGRIRIDGQITATNMGSDNFIEFFADSVEINAATGGIDSRNGSGGLGGIVLIEADNIHVASDEILIRLRDDPFYEGRVDDLNSAGAIDRPDGVLRALGLELFPGETLYIQNTGTATDPAGFYTTIENSDIEPPGFENPEAPDVDVIINGRFQTEGGDVGGRDAFDLIVANAESFDGFTDTSQINGCAFVGGSCTTPPVEEEAPPPVSAAEIEVLTEDQAEEEPFDTEEDEDDAEQSASSPITPPVVLINSRPLNPDVDIDDPVSGSGNPALIGASVTDDAQGDQP